ncbi:MAG: MerR family transcriptional regulator [Candidatus Omnitrophota bacterium]
MIGKTGPQRSRETVGMTEAVRQIGISAERLRYWELKGVISPVYVSHRSKQVRRYSMEDIDVAREIWRLIEDEGFTLKGAAERMNRPYRG